MKKAEHLGIDDPGRGAAFADAAISWPDARPLCGADEPRTLRIVCVLDVICGELARDPSGRRSSCNEST